jgi:hypothetical protein
MPLQKLQFKPGVNRDQTNYTNEGGWHQCDKIRFRSGYPQKIGGWLRYGLFTMLGICRQMFTYITSSSDNLMAMGTNIKLYLDTGGQNAIDITPLEQTLTAGQVTFAATNGSSTITMTSSVALDSDILPGSYVTFEAAVSLGGNITAAVLNHNYEVLTVVGLTITFSATDANGVTVVANASDSGNGGSATRALFDIPIGNATISYGYGWGAGAWSRGGWGSGSITPVALDQRDWFFDNFYNDLIANIRNGAIYLWALDLTFTTRAKLMSTIAGAADVPAKVMQIMVSQGSKHLLAFGATEYGGSTFNPLLIRWSTQDDPLYWTPAPTNSAGFLQVPRGSRIIRAIPTRQEMVVFTDTGLFSLQFLGTTEVFGLQELADNISIAAPRACSVSNNVVYWMGNDKFYAYSGRVETLPSTLRNHVFQNINFDQADQIISGTNEGWNEVWWFYPTENSSVNNAYVIYNYLERIWYYGTIERTAWNDSPLRKYPQAANNGTVYNHEQGLDDDVLPMSAYIDSSDFDLVDGDQFILTKRIIPDLNFEGSTATDPVVKMTIRPRNFPGSAYATSPNQQVIETQVDQYTNQIFLRARARQMGVKISSEDLGVQWQLGSPRLDGRPDGKR